MTTQDVGRDMGRETGRASQRQSQWIGATGGDGRGMPLDSNRPGARRTGSNDAAMRNGVRDATRGQPIGFFARGLGIVSLGLGAAAVVAPGGLARAIGVRDDDQTRRALRLIGLRELASGVGILALRRPVGSLWARVAGDAMDLALLSRALPSQTSRRGRGAQRSRATTATAAVVAITAVDVAASLWLTLRRASKSGRGAADRAIAVRQAITVNRQPADVYALWRDFRNLPRFMRHLESVQVTSDGRSHWKAKAPAGTSVEWDAEIVEDRPNELIAWRSLPGTAVPNTGVVRFAPAPGRRGTEIHVELRYDPPLGKLGATVAKLFGEEPSQQVSDDLRRFKQIAETGQVTRSDASAWGFGPVHHPAQPPKQAPAEMTQR